MKNTIKVVVVEEGGVVQAAFADGTVREIEVVVVSHDRHAEVKTSVSVQTPQPFAKLDKEIRTMVATALSSRTGLPAAASSPPTDSTPPATPQPSA